MASPFRLVPGPLADPAAALADLLALVAPLAGEETVSLADAAGRTLAREVAAPRDLPPCDVSAMDGYAVAAPDLRAGAEPALAGCSFAGRASAAACAPGVAVRVMTGAPVPPGAAAVVPAELAGESGGRVTLDEAVPAGANIRRCGGEVRRGAPLLAAGARLDPPAIAVLAASSVARVAVARRPAVAVLPTGDELVPPSADPATLPAHALADANGPLLSALLAGDGALPRLHPPVPDRPEAVREAILAAARASDLVVTTGGVCAGEADYVDAALAALAPGNRRRYRLALKPGKPLGFALVEGTPVIALAGNPVAAACAYLRFVRPAVARLLGGAPRERLVAAALAAPVVPDRERLELVRGRLEADGALMRVATSPKRDSNMLSGLAAADCLVRVPAGREPLPAGAVVTCELLLW